MGFGLSERGSLDAIAEQVPSSRTRKVLLPIIKRHCREGTIFCSDGWKAYNKLEQHLDLEDIIHYPVNHSNNYVDPVIKERILRQLKVFGDNTNQNFRRLD